MRRRVRGLLGRLFRGPFAGRRSGGFRIGREGRTPLVEEAGEPSPFIGARIAREAKSIGIDEPRFERSRRPFGESGSQSLSALEEHRIVQQRQGLQRRIGAFAPRAGHG